MLKKLTKKRAVRSEEVPERVAFGVCETACKAWCSSGGLVEMDYSSDLTSKP